MNVKDNNDLVDFGSFCFSCGFTNMCKKTQVITVLLLLLAGALHRVHCLSHRRVVQVRSAYVICVCVLLTCSTSAIVVFNQSAGVIADHSQSAKDIDPNPRFQHCVIQHVTVTFIILGPSFCTRQSSNLRRRLIHAMKSSDPCRDYVIFQIENSKFTPQLRTNFK